MYTPNFFLIRSRLFGEILNISESDSDNITLGENVRRLVEEYKEDKHNPPSTIEFDDKEKE